jgi:hypothetical protein
VTVDHRTAETAEADTATVGPNLERLEHYAKIKKQFDLTATSRRIETLLSSQAMKVENITLDGITVPVQDYQREVNAFLFQQRLMNERGTNVVLGITLNSASETVFIPIDLNLRHRIPEAETFEYRFFDDLSNLRTTFDEQLSGTLRQIEKTNLRIKARPYKQGVKSLV